MSWRVVEVLQRRQEQSVQPWENFFEDYCDAREVGWCKKPETDPSWWSNAVGMPRSFELLLEDQFLPVFSGYLKNWLWEMQVPYSLF